ncbi:MAG: CRISPR system precrRNA processing endoribonuclease RAMP protein Cas6 [Planctomycetota bacterium]
MRGQAAKRDLMNADWQVVPLNFNIRLLRSGRFSAFKGITLRGAFGIQFRRTVCATRLLVCDDCRLLKTCAYPYVFNTLAEPSEEPSLRSHRTHAPHPFAIRAPADDRTDVPEGTEWSFRFSLIGHSRSLLPYFIHAFMRLETIGLGSERVPFELLSVTAPLAAGDWEVYRKGSPALRYPSEAHKWPADGKAASATITFRSLTRIKSEGRIARELPFVAFARAILRRVSALHTLYCGPLPERDNRMLLAEAEQIKIVESSLKPITIDRFSTRTKQRMIFDGVVGSITFTGKLDNWLPYIIAVADINVGKGATFGFGVVDVIVH